MNQQQWSIEQERRAVFSATVKAARGSALQSFKYYRTVYKFPQDEMLLEHQVTKIFDNALELGLELGRKENL